MTGVDPKGLSPCPMCGFSAHSRFETFFLQIHHFGECQDADCMTRGPMRLTKADAVEAWNRRALTPLKGAPVAGTFMPAEPSSDHIRALFTMNSALPRTTDEAKAVYQALLNISAASQPLPKTEEKGSAPFDTSISAETKAALAAIDDNIRAAAIQASTTFFGSCYTLPASVTEAAAAILDILNTEALVFPLDAKAKRLAERLALAALASLSLPAPGEEEFIEIARLKHECKCLAEAIANAAKRAGIYNGQVPLTGPHLLLLADDLATVALSPTAPDLGAVKALEAARAYIKRGYVNGAGAAVLEQIDAALSTPQGEKP